MKLYLVRHAETNYNVAKLCNADPSVDVHLTDKGVEQARNLAVLLKPAKWDIVYISQLPRTRQTAEIINQGHGKQIIEDSRLNDNKTGFESRPVADYCEALEQYEDIYTVRLNDGESLRDAANRAIEFIDDLRTKKYESVLVVTHGFITEAIFTHIEHLSLREAAEFSIPQGAYAEFDLF